MASIFSTLFGSLLVSLCVAGVLCDDEFHEGDIRLVNEYSNTTGTGRVEIFHNNEWGTVCDHYWDVIDATVVCKELGFKRARRAPGGAFYGPGSTDQPIWLNGVNCTEAEEKLINCVSSGWGNNQCSHTEDAGVICSNYTAEDGELRLIDGKNESIGRVEIYHDEAWGTICKYDWGYNESMVVCQQLGYSRASYQTRDFGPGDVPIILSQVDCSGAEYNLLDCEHVFSGATDCNDTDVVGVVCFYEVPPEAIASSPAVGVIVGIVIACIVGCVIIGVVIGLVCSSQKQYQVTGSPTTEPSTIQQPTMEPPPPSYEESQEIAKKSVPIA